MSACNHPVTYNTLCVACGKVVPNSKSCASLAVKGGMLQLNAEEALKIQSSKASALQKLQQTKKLALVLDLDHTLLHAVQIDGPTPQQTMQSNGDIHHLPIEEIVGGSVKHLVMKKRPYLDHFLEQAHNLFQMTIYTAGTKRYAEAVVKVIDPSRKYIADRIVSRIDGQPVRADAIDKSLDKIFLNDSSMAVIIDDREDVWKGAQNEQLLLVRPYVYFYPGSSTIQAVGGKSAISEVNNAPGFAGSAPAELGTAPAISLHESPGKILKLALQTSPEFTECDDQLLRCLEVLKNIHQRYYGQSSLSSDSSITRKSVATALKDIKRSILYGYTITFSGIIPTNEPHPENHFLWRLAESLGAQVSLDLLPRTTHLLSFQINTKKVTTCFQTRSEDVWVLHPDWLIYCRWSLAKAEESTFLLMGIPEGKKMPTPKLDTSPISSADSVRVVKKRKVDDVLLCGSESVSSDNKRAKFSDQLEARISEGIPELCPQDALETNEDVVVDGNVLVSSPRDEDIEVDAGETSSNFQIPADTLTAEVVPENFAEDEEQEEDEGDGDCCTYFEKKLSGDYELDEFRVDSADDNGLDQDRYTVTYSLYSQSDAEDDSDSPGCRNSDNEESRFNSRSTREERKIEYNERMGGDDDDELITADNDDEDEDDDESIDFESMILQRNKN